jgi:hypothetical protein
MPWTLDCSSVPSIVDEGHTWNGLTIGISTLEDVETQLAPAKAEWQADRDGYLFRHLYHLDLAFVEACFAENTLSALNIIGTRLGTLPRLLSEWFPEYGEPDLIAFADDYYARSVIWSEKGILVVADQFYEDGVVREGTVRNVMFFSPIPTEDLLTSWLVIGLPSDPGLPPDTWPLPTAESR